MRAESREHPDLERFERHLEVHQWATRAAAIEAPGTDGAVTSPPLAVNGRLKCWRPSAFQKSSVAVTTDRWFASVVALQAQRDLQSDVMLASEDCELGGPLHVGFA